MTHTRTVHLKSYYVVVDKDGNPEISTISGYKNHSIQLFLKDLSETWTTYRKQYGWNCIRVNITFEPL